jgi:hypothetical protein
MAHTIEELLIIEPRLKELVDFAKLPIQKTRDWVDIYHECKMIFQELIGDYAKKEELRNSKDYDTYLQYIVNIIYDNSLQEDE